MESDCNAALILQVGIPKCHSIRDSELAERSRLNAGKSYMRLFLVPGRGLLSEQKQAGKIVGAVVPASSFSREVV